MGIFFQKLKAYLCLTYIVEFGFPQKIIARTSALCYKQLICIPVIWCL